VVAVVSGWAPSSSDDIGGKCTIPIAQPHRRSVPTPMFCMPVRPAKRSTRWSAIICGLRQNLAARSVGEPCPSPTKMIGSRISGSIPGNSRTASIIATVSMSAVGPSAKSCDVPVCHATITYCGAACRFTLRKTATATPHKRTKMAMAASVIGASLRFCASNNCCASLTCRSACSTCRFSSS
jgi:hypothetical protein